MRSTQPNQSSTSDFAVSTFPRPLFTPEFVVGFRPMELARDAREIMEIDAGQFCEPIPLATLRNFARPENKNIVVFVAEIAGRRFKAGDDYLKIRHNREVVGYVVYSYLPRHILIMGMAVRTDSRNLGIGRALFEHVYAKLDDRRIKNVYLPVHEENLDGLAFAKKLGRGRKMFSRVESEREFDGRDMICFQFPFPDGRDSAVAQGERVVPR